MAMIAKQFLAARQFAEERQPREIGRSAYSLSNIQSAYLTAKQ
jgi:hypothetical protein